MAKKTTFFTSIGDIALPILPGGNGKPGVISDMEINLATGNREATASGDSVVLNKAAGTVTTKALTTAAGAVYGITLTNDVIKAGNIILASLARGTATDGAPVISTIAVSDGSAVFSIVNAGAEALNGTLKINFAVFG